MDIQKAIRQVQLTKLIPAFILNILAIYLMWQLLTQGSTDWQATYTFDITLESGKWAIRWLLISLTMTPLKTYLGWHKARKLRKPSGLWAFAFAAIHFIYTLREYDLGWLRPPLHPFIAFGLLGLVILSILALTSNRWAMRRLGKRWKRLHRTVYLAGGMIVYHAILATSSSKKLLVRDPNAVEELNIYLAILAVLLAIRIPIVKHLILTSPVRFSKTRKKLPYVKKIITPIKKVNTITYELGELNQDTYLDPEVILQEESPQEEHLPIA